MANRLRALWGRGRIAVPILLLTALFGFVTVFVRIPVRDAQGSYSSMRIIDVWRLMLNHLPAQAPAFLTRDLLVILMLLAVPVAAYMLVATWRLRR